MKKIIKFIKRNVFSCTCFLLAIAVCLTGTFSYARYISVDSYDRSPGAGSFSCSANIDGVSALSFTNTAFWGGTTSEDKIAMNALRAIEFKVNNFEGTGSDKKVSEVKMNYQLIFSAPKNFIEKLAIQLFDDTSTAILPQIVLQDLVKSSGIYNTASSEDFNGSPATDLIFTVTKSGNDFTATAGDIKIEIDEVNIEIEQALQYRVWDVSALTNETNKVANTEGGKLLPPLEVKFTSEVTCYRIKISMPQFKFDAGTEQTRDYSLRLVPTATLEDDHLGGYLMDGTEKPTTIYAGQTLGVQTVKEAISDYTDEACTSLIPDSEQIVNVHGEPKKYTVGTPITDSPLDYPPTTTTTIQNLPDEISSSGSHEAGNVVPGATSEFSSWVMYKSNDDVTTNENNASYRTRTATQTGTTTVTITKKVDRYNEIKTLSQSTVQTVTTPKSVNGNTFVLQIDRKTTLNVASTETTESYLTSTTVQTQNWTRTGTYRQDRERTGRYPNYTYYWGESYLQGNWSAWTKSGNVDEETTDSDTRTYLTPQINNTSTTTDNTDTFFRKIIRSYENIDITLTSVKRQVQVGTEFQTEEYTSSTDAFDLFEGDEIQNYYLSQSYSKNYPLKVNVIFEQTQ
ncbi:MAG: hypothetical protein J6B79_04540 [Clostridia bacterium]|nr:hypothetical protein [Clostridia bacterium]